MWKFGLVTEAVDFAAVLKSPLISTWRFIGVGGMDMKEGWKDSARGHSNKRPRTPGLPIG